MRTRARGGDPPLVRLHETMALARAFEEAIGELWRQGLISGELHLGIGEEAVAAGVVDHLRPGDGLALDHRSTPVLVARGTDLESLVREMLGDPRGICHGHGGHMHLFDPERLAASSGIVGASAPTACGFALSHQLASGGSVAVSFMGEGAVNQGMVPEAWNLAVAWRLPVVFVVKDSGWSITTRTARMTGGDLVRRGRGFGLAAERVDGGRVDAVWSAAGRAMTRARRGGGPSLLVASVRRPRGHLEDDPLVRMSRDPRELGQETRVLLRSAARGRGQRAVPRARGVAAVARTLTRMVKDQTFPSHEPLRHAARYLDQEVVRQARADAVQRVERAVSDALATDGATT